jgi:epoxyqueuosine reductase QueG
MSDIISEHQEILVRTLKENGASLVGFGDVSMVSPELTGGYPVAISLAVKYNEKIVENRPIDEDALHRHQQDLKVPLRRLISITEDLLSKWGYGHENMLTSTLIESDKQLRELKTFPHKTAATCAGLGWIGKCALLVTPEYGPRVILGTVLTDAGFKTAEPVVGDRCGKCSLCVEACPYGAIHNVNWKRGVERDKLFDAYLCNAKRLEYVPVTGKKRSCGLCLQACKVGKK